MQIKFNTPSGDRFYADLTRKVNQYFKDNDVKKTANIEMGIKTVSMIALYWLPYVAMLVFDLPWWVAAIGCVLMGMGMAGIGMAVMHDANHGSYSQNKYINKLLGYTSNMLGANKFNWVVQHNIKHHTYTNIQGMDEDIENGGVIRLTPHSDWKWFHRFQHIYSWFLYTLNTFSWVVIKDFRTIFQYKKENYVKNKKEFTREMLILFGSKIVYFFYILVLPVLVTDFTFWEVLLGFTILHAVSGFILSVTFQLAHVVENKHFESKDIEVIEASWAAHQVKTTANFAPKSRLLNWYLGGLNFQIEHHLFPNICHVHYRRISKIVSKTIKEHGMEYHNYKYMFSAILSHYRTLKAFSRKPA